LLEHAEELVTKATLYEAVWRAENVVVGDDALTTCIHEIRRALGEKIKEPRYIETRHKYGYRFIGPIAAAPLAESRDEVASRQHSVVSKEKIETRSSQLITENWQLTTPLVGREAELAQLHGWL
jgi:DNA-binding winged helix-turn-helix (wHTH) protein